MTLTEILQDTSYKLTQFNLAEIQDLEKRIFLEEVKNKQTPHVKCLIRNKDIRLTPEEVIRQLFLSILINDYAYPTVRIALEYLVSFGRGENPNGRYRTKIGRDILFIERNLDFLKSGGRMAIVLPQGRFNNSSDKPIREFIAERCRILAVVGLHGNVFKPHTGTKTSVLFVQKWDDKLCPKTDDYPIFFATMQESSKNNSGEKIYLKKKDFPDKYKARTESSPSQPKIDFVEEIPENYVQSVKELDEYVRDSHHHIIVKHDLYNHEGITRDGIAEAFLEFAKKENLSFSGKD